MLRSTSELYDSSVAINAVCMGGFRTLARKSTMVFKVVSTTRSCRKPRTRGEKFIVDGRIFKCETKSAISSSELSLLVTSLFDSCWESTSARGRNVPRPSCSMKKAMTTGPCTNAPALTSDADCKSIKSRSAQASAARRSEKAVSTLALVCSSTIRNSEASSSVSGVVEPCCTAFSDMMRSSPSLRQAARAAASWSAALHPWPREPPPTACAASPRTQTPAATL
mmetsp:Transcript_57664/g.137174  ORF Transcript_57664/g.137174 Transcript_57664/m.137174 type:complete len:224 (-) Transcript_57664:1361-2032(-)